MKTIHAIYRISDNGYVKEKFDFATKQYCLDNFIKSFPGAHVHVLLDETNLRNETFTWVKGLKDQEKIHNLLILENRPDDGIVEGGSSAASFRTALLYALEDNKDSRYFGAEASEDDIIYFVEDDYLHKQNSEQILREGIERADYVTLYLHGDRFIPAAHGGNKFVDVSGAFVTRLFKTNSSFWCQIESTTMTFASTTKQLLTDSNIWTKHIQGTHPMDFEAFVELGSCGRTLIAPVPGYSTHCEPKWQSPLIDWRNI